MPIWTLANQQQAFLFRATGAAGATIWGGLGAAWGMAVGYPIGAAVCWLAFRAELRAGALTERRSPTAAPGIPVAAAARS